MSLVSLLATTSLITMANATPLIYTDDQRAKVPVDHDHFLMIQLLTQRDMGLQPQDESGGQYNVIEYESDSEGGGGGGTAGDPVEGGEAIGGRPSHARDKRIGSLSIVNSVDVLRQRVLLELARRKAMEDQRQINENRRLLDYVGKRSGYRGRQQRIPRRGRLQYEPEDPELLPRLDRLQ